MVVDPYLLGVLAYRPEADPEALAPLLSRALGLDVHKAEAVARGGAPIVLARLDRPAAERAAAMMRGHLITPTVVREADVRIMPDPVWARSLDRAIGAPHPMYGVGLSRGDAPALVMDDVVLLVRGRIRRARTVTTTAGLSGDTEMSGRREPSAPATAIDRQILDVYRTDGSRVRIDGDRFNFGVLGADRGLTDSVNADQLAVMLAGEAPYAEVDTGFARFRSLVPLAEVARARDGPLRTTTTVDFSPLFEVYSAWRFLARFG